jgi:hypothetical protein
MPQRKAHAVVRVKLGDAWPEHRGFPDALQHATVKVVCEPCNNGWMSRLETEAQPFILDLLAGAGVLGAYGLQVIGRWAVKTAMMFEFQHPRSVVATQAMRDTVAEGGVTQGALVMLGTRRPPGEPLDVTHLGLAIGGAPDDPVDPLLVPHNYAKTTIALGRLLNRPGESGDFLV